MSIDWEVLRCELVQEFGGRSNTTACVEGATVDDDIQAAIEDVYGMSTGAKPLPGRMALPLTCEQWRQLARGKVLTRIGSRHRSGRRRKLLLQEMPQPHELEIVQFFEQLAAESERAYLIRELQADRKDDARALALIDKIMRGESKAAILQDMSLTSKQYEIAARRLCKAADRIRKSRRGPGGVA